MIKEILNVVESPDPTMGGGSALSQQTVVGGNYLKPERDALTDPELTGKVPFIKENMYLEFPKIKQRIERLVKSVGAEEASKIIFELVQRKEIDFPRFFILVNLLVRHK